MFLTPWIAAARWGGEFKTTQSAAQDLAKTAQSRGLKVELKTMDEAAIQLVSGDHGDHGGPDCDPDPAMAGTILAPIWMKHEMNQWLFRTMESSSSPFRPGFAQRFGRGQD